MKLDKKNVEDLMNLTPVQKGMLFHYLNEQNSNEYIEQLIVELEGEIQCEKFIQCWKDIIRENEVLRTIFVWENVSNPIQVVLKNDNNEITIEDISNEIEADEIVQDYIKRDLCNQFDLSVSAFRLKLFKYRNNKYTMIVTNHHIIYDGWSNGIILNEFWKKLNSNNNTNEKKCKFKEFVNVLGKQDHNEQDNFWKEYLHNLSEEAELSIKKTAKKALTNNVLKKTVEKKSLIEFCETHNITMANLMYAAYGLLVAEYNGINDIVFGTTVSGRNVDINNIENAVGLFINTIPLRVSVDNNESIIDYVRKVQESSNARIKYENTPLNRIKKQTRKTEELFDSIIVVENYPLSFPESHGVKLQSFVMNEKSNYDLTIGIGIYDNIEMEFNFNSGLYDENAIERLANHYCNVLGQIVSKYNEPLKCIKVITEEEENNILNVYNNTEREYTQIHFIERFKQIVEKYPNLIAVSHYDQKLDYQGLDKSSDIIARNLLKLGVKKGNHIGIMMEKSLTFIEALVGIIKAGAAYVPIDAAYPLERKNYIAKNSEIKLVIVDSLENDICCPQYVAKELFDDTAEVTLTDIEFNLLDEFAIIYTSGTTGRPKGVQLLHKNLSNLLAWFSSNYNISQEDNILQLTQNIFDVSIEDIFGALYCGATIVVPNEDVLSSEEKFSDTIKKNEITIINFIPTILKEVLINGNHYETLRVVICGGERLDNEIKGKLLNHGYKLYNNYGPAEAMVDTLSEECSEKNVSLGSPISNVKCLIINKNGKLCPVGVKGELIISGENVAKGYVNNDKLTAEKFVTLEWFDNARFYKTGDIVMWNEEGKIEFIGREDYQVKINGKRIELDEISNAIRMQGDAVDNVVVVRENKIVAYIVKPDGDLDEIKRYLSDTLPKYMQPSYYVLIDSIPLTPIGKIDYRALPKVEMQRNLNFKKPQNKTEKLLREIWADVLKIEETKISVNDNFYDLGGDSIISLQIVGKLSQNGISIVIKDILETETIERLASRIINNKQKEVLSEKNCKLEGEVGLLPIQSWFFDSKFTDYNYWNQSVLLKCADDLKLDVVVKTLKCIEDEFDIFNIYFEKNNENWIQKYKEESSKIDFVVVENEKFQNEELSAVLGQEAGKLDITKGKMMRVVYFEKNKLLFVCIHHLVVDGVSWRILLDRFANIYSELIAGNEIKSTHKSATLQSCSELLKEKSNEKDILSDATFWLNKENTCSESIKVDFNGENLEHSADTVVMSLDEKNTSYLLHNIHKIKHTTVNDILLAALGKSITAYNDTDVLVDVEGHGREIISAEIDMSNTMGWFTSIYPIKLSHEFSKMDSVTLLETTKGVIRKLPKQGASYALLKYLSDDKEIRKQFKRLSRAEICFNYFGQVDNTFEKDSNFAPVDDVPLPNYGGNNLRTYKIEVDCVVMKHSLVAKWKYSTNNFKKETIERLARAFIKNIEDLLKSCEKISWIVEDFENINISDDRFKELTTNYGDIADIYGVSPVQESMIFHTAYSPDSSVAVEQTVFRVQGNLNIEAFEKAWNTILNRHESLKATYHWRNLEHPIQVIHNNLTLPFEVINMEEKDDYKKIREELLAEDREKGFDLEVPPLMRVIVLKVSNDVYDIIWTYHHLQMDGWCIRIIMQELDEYYSKYANNEKVVISSEVPFKDYITWLNKKDQKETEKFWKETLKGMNKPTLLSSVVEVKGEKKNEKPYDVVEFAVNSELNEEISRFTKEKRITLSTLMQGAWALVMQRYINENDLIFGVTSSGRPTDLPGSDDIIGCFMNTIPLRVSANYDMNIDEYLKNIQEKYLRQLQYDYSSLSTIRKMSEIPRESALYDLYDCMVIVENYPFEEAVNKGFGGMQGKCLNVEEQLDYPCTLYCNVHGEFNFKLLFDTNFFERKLCENILEHFVFILEEIIFKKRERIKDIAVLPENQYKLIEEWNDTQMEFPNDSSYIDLFEDTVRKFGERIAVACEEQKISYNELNERAERIACILEKSGIVKDSLVAIYLDREIDLVCSICAILKLGAAFVPIDISYPESRINYMIESEKMKVILTKEKYRQKVAELGKTYICIDSEVDTEAKFEKKKVTPENLAYVIFTSGTTGKPKGIVVNNRSIVSHSIDIKNRYELVETDNVLQFSSIAFDISLEQVLSTLVSGATLVLRGNDVWSPTELSKNCEKYKLSVINLPTAYWNEVTYEWSRNEQIIPLDTLRLMIVGGEQMKAERVKLWKNSRLKTIKLLNAYGPAETCMTSTLCDLSEVDLNSVIPVGKPLANRRIYILDENQRMVPIGVAGELYISGNVAQGYLDNLELTEKSFLTDIFDDSKVMYKTGDIGRYSNSGNIELFGRKDNQVKIRSHRIEISEIEKVLYKIADLKDVYIDTKEDQNSDKFLVAYIVYKDGCSYESNEIKKILEKELPKYMVPKFIVKMEQLPVTINGKIDRTKLPNEFEQICGEDNSLVCTEPVEQKLKDIWENILSIKVTKKNDDFFELGGDSIKAMQLISEIGLELKVDVSLENIFMHSTFEEVFECIQKQSSVSHYLVIPKCEKKEYYRTSETQKNMYLMQKIDENDLNYNMPYLIEMKGAIDREKLQEALGKVIQKHESLRTNYTVKNGELVQFINEDYNFDLKEIEATDVDKVVKENSKPFDLEKDLLVRALLIKIAKDNAVLFIDFNHIACDGISIGIIIKDFIAFYQGNAVEGNEIDYKDFAEYEYKYVESDEYKNEENYWSSKFKNETPVLRLPYDKESKTKFNGELLNMVIDETITREIKQYVKVNKTTMFNFLIGAYSILLSKYSNMEDFVIGTPVSRREKFNVDKMVGVFINTVPIRVMPQKRLIVSKYIKNLTTQVSKDLCNSTYPYSKLVEKLTEKGMTDAKNLVNTMFAYYNIDIPKIRIGNLDISERKYFSGACKFDLELKAYEENDTIFCDFEYCSDVFEKETIMRFMKDYQRIIEMIICDENIKIENIKLQNQKTVINLSNNNNLGRNFSDEFKQVAKKYPTNIAFVQNDTKITYQEIDKKSDIIANAIRQKVGKTNQIIAVISEPTIEFMVGILAIMKAKCVYLPIDLELPRKQIEDMLLCADCKYVLSNDLDMDFISTIISNDDEINNVNLPENELIDNEIVYVMYTSGTTGNAKGVMVKHESLINYSEYILKQLGLSEDDRSILVSGVNFDLGYTNIFPMLLAGGQIHLLQKEEYCNMEYLLRYMHENKITISKMTPTLLTVMVDDPYFSKCKELYLKYLILGGEKLDRNTIVRFAEKSEKTKIINHYGPTETTIGCCTHELTIKEIEDGEVNIIGQSIDNVYVRILDENLNDVLIGVEGEIYIGGKGVSRGYINNDILNNSCFVRKVSINEELLMYKTGDIGKYNNNGDIMFIGRQDNQIKINGYRIELDEIKNKLLEIHNVNNAIVLARKTETDEIVICAYYTCLERLDNQEVIDYLNRELPTYKKPQIVACIETIPMTNNGKIDVKKLPKVYVDYNQKKVQYSKPRNEIETQLVGLYEEVLGVDNIGIDDDFFELGGTSIKIIKLASLARNKKITINIKDLMERHTIRELSSLVKNTEIDDTLRNYNKNYVIHDKYPYYYACLTGNICEVLKYNHGINMEKSIFELGELGKTVYSIQKKTLNEEDYKFAEVSIDDSISFAYELRKCGMGLNVESFDCYAEMEKRIECELSQNRIVIVTGTTYYLPYSKEYQIDIDEWKESFEGRQNNLRLKEENEKTADHSFVVIDKVEGAYLVYDTTFQYYGLVEATDFKKSLEGIANMEAFKDSYLVDVINPLTMLTINMPEEIDFDLQSVIKNILRNTAEINLNKCTQSENERFIVGIRSIKYVADVLQNELNNDKLNANVIRVVSESLIAWKYKLIFMRDFILETKKYHVIKDVDSIADYVQKTESYCRAIRETIETASNIVEDVKLINRIIKELNELYEMHKEIYTILYEESLNDDLESGIVNKFIVD